MIPGHERLPDCKIIETPHIEMVRGRVGGQPCLLGTRMTVAQILAEVIQGAMEKGVVKEFCENFDLDRELVERVLYEVTDFYGRCHPEGLLPHRNWKYTAIKRK